jgi:hypothetical protein
LFSFKKYTIGDLEYEDIDDLAKGFINNELDGNIRRVFERSKYELFCSDFKNNTKIFHQNDITGVKEFITAYISQNIELEFDIPVVNGTTKNSPIIRYLYPLVKPFLGDYVKNIFAFVKGKVKKDKFSDNIREQLYDEYKSTYEFLKTL